MKKLIVAVLVVLLASSCVSNKKFNSMKAEALRLEGELAASRNRLDDMTGQNEKLAAEKARLVADTVRLSGELNDYRRYQELERKLSVELIRLCENDLIEETYTKAYTMMNNFNDSLIKGAHFSQEGAVTDRVEFIDSLLAGDLDKALELVRGHRCRRRSSSSAGRSSTPSTRSARSSG